ncbi:MAG TPA: hypothetical protein VEG84_09980 [Thermoanaerobaculia bacterium]|nr:hypothetical protein [Thermoanaerobaculia bacterium]
MSVSFVLLAVLAFLLLAALVLIPVVRVYRGTRLVACPETRRPAAVELDALRAAFLQFGDEPGRLRLTSCSRWPEKAGCGQECLAEVERDPGACLLRTIVADWYRGGTCVFCGKAIPEVTWTEHRPALLAPDGVTVSWKDVKPEALPDLFSTHKPVCWDCHVVQSLIRERPDTITVRPEREHLWT